MSRHAWTVLVLTAFCTLMSCGQPTNPPVRTARQAPEPAPEPAPQLVATEVAPVPEPTPAEPPRDTAVDLLALRGQAERRLHDVLMVDFGGPAGARYTLGGWSTRVREVDLGTNHAIVSEGTRGRILIPSDGGETHLRVRMRGFRPGRATIYIDGDTIGSATLTTEFADYTFEAEGLEPGEHTLMVRASRTSTLAGVGRVGVAIDTLAVASAEIPESLPAMDLRALAAGETLRWPVVVPAGGRVDVVAEQPVVVRILRDGEAAQEETGDRLNVPLGAAGDVVWVELGAAEATQLAHVAVSIPERTERTLSQVKNVLLVLIDTLRADELSPYRPDTRVQTPRLQGFADAATTFDHAHSQENWTKPSVATLLTSLMPWEHGATQHASVLPRSVEMLPEVLSDQGFETAAFICNGFVSDRFGFRQGWDSYRNYIREGRRTRSQFVAADVLEWLDETQDADPEKPFFLYVHTIDPHVPYRPPREFVSMYGNADYRGVVNFSRDATLLENIKLGNLRLGEADRAHLRALYDAEISYHDVHFGAILDGLERRGLSDSTLVVVTSDHGEEFWDHGSVGHGHSVYEELLHVPMFVRIPGEAPRRVVTPVGLVDVMPTILQALELPIPEQLSGRSFLPSLREAGSSRGPGTVSGFMENWRTYSVGRWKLIERPGNRSAVYDLMEDPGETQNLAPSRPLTRRALRGWLGMRLAETRRAPSRRRSRNREETPEPAIDAETAAQLRALGYIVD